MKHTKGGDGTIGNNITDWLMLIITFVYVIATIAIWKSNKESADASKKQAEFARRQTDEMIRQYNEYNRPVITIKFDIVRGNVLCFVFKNEGPVAALDVRLQINDEFLDNLEVHQKSGSWLRSITQSNLYIQKGQQYYILLGPQSKFKEIAKEKALINITYRDGKKEYREHEEIDLMQAGNFFLYSSELSDIVQCLRNMEVKNEYFYRKFLEAAEKAQLLAVSSRPKYSDKIFEVYKTISLSSGINEEQIAKATGIEVELVNILVKELNYVYGVVYSIPDIDNLDEAGNPKLRWYKEVGA